MNEKTELTYGMVGGDIKAFIGEVHRKSIGFDNRCRLVCGSFSINPELHIETANQYHIAPDRRYDTYQEMALKESQRKDKIDFVVIVTPNSLHYTIAKEFILKHINVVCEKPLCFTLQEANELYQLAKENNVMFAINYGYTGYTMIKLAKEMVSKKELGKLLSIQVEYAQDWLTEAADPIKGSEVGKNIWRLNPKMGGPSCTVGDIGTHAENLVRYLTGFNIKRLVAETDTYGQALDLNSNMIIEYENGLRAGLWCSQVAIGNDNGLSIKIFGSLGSLEWHQQSPDYLLFTKIHEPTMRLVRGSKYLSKYKANATSRLPAGHPEGLYEAFANNYRNIISYLIKEKRKEKICSEDLDFPKIEDGVDGVRFIAKVLESAQKKSWVNF